MTLLISKLSNGSPYVLQDFETLGKVISKSFNDLDELFATIAEEFNDAAENPLDALRAEVKDLEDTVADAVSDKEEVERLQEEVKDELEDLKEIVEKIRNLLP